MGGLTRALVVSGVRTCLARYVLDLESTLVLSDALRKASISHEIIGFREALRRGVFVRSRPWPLPGVQDLPEPRRAPAARTRHAGRPGDAREGLGMAGRIPGNSFLQVPIWCRDVVLGELREANWS